MEAANLIFETRLVQKSFYGWAEHTFTQKAKKFPLHMKQMKGA